MSDQGMEDQASSADIRVLLLGKPFIKFWWEQFDHLVTGHIKNVVGKF